jgi:hypothetical protein
VELLLGAAAGGGVPLIEALGRRPSQAALQAVVASVAVSLFFVCRAGCANVHPFSRNSLPSTRIPTVPAAPPPPPSLQRPYPCVAGAGAPSAQQLWAPSPAPARSAAWRWVLSWRLCWRYACLRGTHTWRCALLGASCGRTGRCLRPSGDWEGEGLAAALQKGGSWFVPGTLISPVFVIHRCGPLASPACGKPPAAARPGCANTALACLAHRLPTACRDLVKLPERRAAEAEQMLRAFCCFIPKVSALRCVRARGRGSLCV